MAEVKFLFWITTRFFFSTLKNLWLIVIKIINLFINYKFIEHFYIFQLFTMQNCFFPAFDVLFNSKGISLVSRSLRIQRSISPRRTTLFRHRIKWRVDSQSMQKREEIPKTKRRLEVTRISEDDPPTELRLLITFPLGDQNGVLNVAHPKRTGWLT